MAKDEINISGEKLLALKDGLEKMAEFADRLRISLRTATELTKPGVHPLRMDTLDKIAAGLGTDRIGAFKMIGTPGNGQDSPTPDPARDLILRYGSKEAAMAALEKAWSDPEVRKAARKPKKS